MEGEVEPSRPWCPESVNGVVDISKLGEKESVVLGFGSAINWTVIISKNGLEGKVDVAILRYTPAYTRERERVEEKSYTVGVDEILGHGFGLGPGKIAPGYHVIIPHQIAGYSPYQLLCENIEIVSRE